MVEDVPHRPVKFFFQQIAIADFGIFKLHNWWLILMSLSITNHTCGPFAQDNQTQNISNESKHANLRNLSFCKKNVAHNFKKYSTSKINIQTLIYQNIPHSPLMTILQWSTICKEKSLTYFLFCIGKVFRARDNLTKENCKIVQFVVFLCLWMNCSF